MILSQKKLIEDLMFQPKVGAKLSASAAIVAPLTELVRTKYITEKENPQSWKYSTSIFGLLAYSLTNKVIRKNNKSKQKHVCSIFKGGHSVRFSRILTDIYSPWFDIDKWIVLSMSRFDNNTFITL